MIDSIKLLSALTGISVIAALLISLTWSHTRSRIETVQELTIRNSIGKVMPSGTTISEVRDHHKESPQHYWIGMKNGDTVAYAFTIAERGYSNSIIYLVGIDKAGTIAGVTILKHSEFSGLGSRIEEVATKRFIWKSVFNNKESSDPWFCEQFKGISVLSAITIDRTVGEWYKLNESQQKGLLATNKITALTGATISTEAVVKGIKTTASTYFKSVRGIR